MRALKRSCAFPDGKGGYISPLTCIPVIEAMGLINAVGKWVIEEATRTAATWPSHLFVAVNLSVKQFADGALGGPREERAGDFRIAAKAAGTRSH